MLNDLVRVLRDINSSLEKLERGFFKVRYLEIVFMADATVTVGKTLNFTVFGDNAAGHHIPVTGVTVSVDANGSATVNDDGTGGVFTGSDVGTATLTATNGTFTTTKTVDVTEDITLVGIEIVFA